MREKTFKLSKAFIEYSNTSNDVYNNINDTIQIGTEKIKLFLMILLLVLTLIKFQAMIKELFIRCRKLNISPVFITQSYFFVRKDVRLNSAWSIIRKIQNKREL